MTRHDPNAFLLSCIEAAAAKGRSGLFDSHPSDAERLCFAAVLTRLVRLPGPATQLLSNFPALAAYFTSVHYAQLLRLPDGEDGQIWVKWERNSLFQSSRLK